MKKIIALLVAILCVSVLALPAHATSDDAENIAKFQHETLEPLHNQQPAVFVEYDEERGYLIIKGKQGPLLKNIIANYDTYNTMFPGYTFICSVLTDVKFDDGPWRSKKLYDLGALDMFSEPTPTITQWTGDTFGYVFFDLNKYHPEYDAVAFWSSAVEKKDGRLFIDFSKHTMSVRIKIQYRWMNDETSVTFVDYPASISALHNEQISIQVTPEKPDIKDAVLNITDKQVLLSFNKSSTVQEMLNYRIPVEIGVSYIVNDGQETDVTLTPITSSNPTIILAAPQPLTNISESDAVTFRIWYRNAQTGEKSEVAEITPTIKTSAGFDQSIPPDAIVQTTPECRLCHNCSQPLGVCMWTVIGGAISATLIVVSAAWYIILIVNKRKEQNNGKN